MRIGHRRNVARGSGIDCLRFPARFARPASGRSISSLLAECVRLVCAHCARSIRSHRLGPRGAYALGRSHRKSRAIGCIWLHRGRGSFKRRVSLRVNVDRSGSDAYVRSPPERLHRAGDAKGPCGELYALILTGERVVGTRKAAQVIIRAAVECQAAERPVDETEAALASTDRSNRLERALDAKTAADLAVINKSAERGCASNCRALLQAQVDAAQREVDAALVEQDNARDRARKAVEAARAELPAIGLPASASPLAARLGLPAWALDLVAAGLASLAINGLGAALLAFGAHGRRGETEPAPPSAIVLKASELVPPFEPKLIASPRDGLAQSAKFAVDSIRPDADGVTPVRDVRAAYLRWCRNGGHDALPARDMADRLAALCAKAGLLIDANNGNPLIRGIKLHS